jgi:energy-coupling factor transport system ATP-binding protein
MPVSFTNVSYIYNRKSPFEYAALKGINLVLPDGGFYALVGKTGSGKSTLVSHINALLNPSDGVVKVDDFINSATKKGRSKDLLSLRKKVGLVFQFPEYQLFEETVEKDVAFAPRNFGASKDEALKQAHEALAKVGLDASFYTRSPFELSGGEKRKVAIAGILAAKPKILIVDEPTAGLDPMASLETMDLFESIHKEGVTIILVTHDMNLVAKYASEVVVLEDGKIDRVSKPSELFKEDISKYSLETPLLYKVAKDLNAKGYKLDISSISSVDDLAKAIAKEKR